MESLLASYASDDDEDVEEGGGGGKGTAPEQALVDMSSIPRNETVSLKKTEEDEEERRASVEWDRDSTTPLISTSLFSSLPPPKHFSRSILLPIPFDPSQASLAPSFRASNKDNGDNVRKLSSVDEADPGSASPFGPPRAHGKPPAQTAGASGIATSFISSLPPPRGGEGGRKGAIIQGAAAGSKGKRVVSFQLPLPINAAALIRDAAEEAEEEEDRKRRKREEEKRLGTAGGAGRKGLAAFLPPPKQSLGLGSGALGGGSGRRLHTGLDGAESTGVPLASSTPGKAVDHRGVLVHDGSDGFQKVDAWGGAGEDYVESFGEVGSREAGGECVENLAVEDWEEPRRTTAAWDSSLAPGALPLSSPVGYTEEEECKEGRRAEGGKSSSTSVLEQSDAWGASWAGETGERPWGGEGRKRGRGLEGIEAGAAVVEVKQADLTKGRPREDQLRATGIAFGPAYQAVSSSRDKPSKIHRRKHQIGSLYFDMKQKEMELLERRAKGMLTKSETQGKYGW